MSKAEAIRAAAAELEAKRKAAAQLKQANKAMIEEAVEAGTSATPEFIAKYKAAGEEFDALQAEITGLEAHHKALLADMADDSAPVDPLAATPGAAPAARGASMGERFAASSVIEDLRSRPGGLEGRAAIGSTQGVPVASREEFRALLTTPAGVVAPDQAPGIRPLPLVPPLTVLDMVTWGTTDSDTVKWVREKAFDNQAGIQANQGDAKNESAIELEPVEFSVQTYAHWLPAAKQALADVSGLRTLVDAKLAWGLRRMLAKEIIDTLTATQGLPSLEKSGATVEHMVEDLYDSIMTIYDTTGEMPDAVFANRVDHKALRFARHDKLTVGEDVEMVGGFMFGPPSIVTPIEIEGVPVLVNPDVTAGSPVVGLWREFGVWLREGVTTSVSDSHEDFFIRNLVAILSEFRAAIGAMELAAFCMVEDAD